MHKRTLDTSIYLFATPPFFLNPQTDGMQLTWFSQQQQQKRAHVFFMNINIATLVDWEAMRPSS